MDNLESSGTKDFNEPIDANCAWEKTEQLKINIHKLFSHPPVAFSQLLLPYLRLLGTLGVR